MKSCSIILTLILTSSLNVMAQINSAKRVKEFNLSKTVAISGYDPVAYFKQGKAIAGKNEFSVITDGVTYYCSSPVNKELLQKNPANYEPQYGGWCAYAMGSSGEKVEVDPETFKIINNKLYLYYNAYFNNTLKSWNKDETNLKQKADVNWSKFYK